ncbi:MAG: peptidoglycan DD-metalloendopeptidase family protein [Bacteroidales bacterium]|nr:peptidoglycan DD-metalloendopeptidase family protein [Bacteroidales bacterium]
MKKKILIIGLAIAGMAVIAGLIWIGKDKYTRQHIAKISEPDTVIAESPVLLFGIPVDSFYTETGIVRRNQIPAQIMGEYNLPRGAMARLITLDRDEFDMRKIKAGNHFTVFLTRDSSSLLQYFVYEHSPVDFSIFDFTDSLRIIGFKKSIDPVEKRVCGRIETSLWNTIMDHDLNPMLALELSDIYAWTVDFFGIQPGDSFSVVYDELYVDTMSVGIGKIHAACFRQNGREYYAIPFVQDSVESYYDADGSSLRRTFLKAPLHFRRISSRFSHSRLHPILRIRRPHHGVDYAAPVGTPVFAIGDGKVLQAVYRGQAGRLVKIRHNSVYTSAYLHLSRFGKDIRPGAFVRQGQVIGYVGSTGLSTGPHLDFRVYKNGSAIDPLKMESPPVEPVKPGNWLAFDAVKEVTLNKLMPPREDTLLTFLTPVFDEMKYEGPEGETGNR